LKRRSEATQGLWIFLVAFGIRLVAAAITTVTNLNPDSHADARVFASTADYIADGLLQGQLIFPDVSITFRLWGLFLAPFWLVPGPSGFYGRVGNAFLGAFAIYNVYVIARYYHSHRAGVIAAIPLIFYPSIVAVHSTLLREAIILFGITTAVRFVICPPQKRFRWLSYGIAAVALYLAHIHRPDNFVIYIAAFGVGGFVYAFESGYLSKRTTGITAALSPLLVIASWSFIQSGLEYLSYIREVRGGGRTDYLLNTIPQTLPEFAAFSWIGAAYFLYAPFPWMIETIPDLLVSTEGLITMGFTVAALWGVRTLAQRNKAVTAALVVGFLLTVVFYGVGTVNYGTGMRHRQMFSWIIFLFGGIGIAEHVHFTGLPTITLERDGDRD
jgi:hypothetical protein